MEDINLTNVGTVDECGSKKYIEWKIYDYFSLSQKQNYTFKSPPFSFLNEIWYLIIYPFGHIGTDSVEYVGIFATKSCFPPLKYRITCKVGIKISELYKYVSFSDDKVSAGKYMWGTSKLLLQSTLLKDKNRVAPHGILTVFCTLRVKNIEKESKINWKETELSKFVFGSIPKQLSPFTGNLFASNFKFSTPETKPNNISASSMPSCSRETFKDLIPSTINFNPPTGTDTCMINGVSTTIGTRLQNITCMHEYTFTSVEELRVEHYASSKKKSAFFPSAPPPVSHNNFDFNSTMKKAVFSLPKTTETKSTKSEYFTNEAVRFRPRRRYKISDPEAKPSNTLIPSKLGKDLIIDTKENDSEMKDDDKKYTLAGEPEVADVKEKELKIPGQEDNNEKNSLEEENVGSTTKQTSSFGATKIVPPISFNFGTPVIKPSSFSAAKENAGGATERTSFFGAKNLPSFSFNFDMPVTKISSTSATSKDSIIDTGEKDSAKKDDDDEKYVLSGKATVLERREGDYEMVDESDVLAGEAAVADAEEKKSTEQGLQNQKDILGGLNELSQDFKNLLLSGEDSDTVMKVGNQEFKVHKTVLQARSSVFASMFRNDFKEKTDQTVNITDCDPDAFQRFLLYLYSGKVEKMSSDHVLDLYRTADKYDVKLLKAWCIEFFINNLSVDSFCDVMTLALEYEESALIENATEFFAKNIREIIVTVKWLSFHKEHPIESNELHIKALSFLHSR